jgi:dolichol kinase
MVRKSIHLLSLAIPIIYLFVPRTLALQMCVPITLFAVTIDFGRHYLPPLQRWYNHYFGFLLRQHESDSRHKSLNGATALLISATLCITIFPKFIAITAFFVLIVCDLAAALIGRKFGRHKFCGKSLEGSTAFFVSGAVIIFLAPVFFSRSLISPTTEYAIGLIAVAAAAVVEAIPNPIDDNVTVPFTVCVVMWGLYQLLLPGALL